MMGVLLLVFILFGSLTVMNMLLGVLVEARPKKRKTFGLQLRPLVSVDFSGYGPPPGLLLGLQLGYHNFSSELT